MSEPAKKGLNDKGLIDENTKNVNVGGHKELVREGQNAFGGKNPVGLYVPMSEDEQEVLMRLQESQDLQLVIHGWGTIPNPVMVVGDHRVGIKFRITFKGLLVAQPLPYLDLELKLGNGMSIYRDRKPTLIDNKPIMISEGMHLDLQWDIAIRHMEPEFVRLIKPGATGLTSRRQDKDTKEMTDLGNMRLDVGRQALLRKVEDGQRRVRKMDEVEAIRASASTGEKLVKTKDGVEYNPTGS